MTEAESVSAKRSSSQINQKEAPEVAKETTENLERSTKRQRTEEPESKAAEESSKEARIIDDGKPETAEIAILTTASEQKKNKKIKPQTAVQQDKPIITLLSVTSDGKHVVAVSGHDKAIWVFEHDGRGKLMQSSKRTMPKRPCGIALAQDERTIIAADKFGDVYALPLLPSDTVAKGPTLTLAVKHKRETPAATPLTVHSAGNLRSLEAQKRHMAERQKQQEQERAAVVAAASSAGVDAPEAPMFEHSLVLGHVSMLTDIIVARGSSQNQPPREFIITADRDEHIRVSRAPPHAYVIEGFCLAHKDFVSTLAIDENRPEIMVSAGGDAEVFVWDWQNSELLSQTEILSVAKEHFSVEKIAVSKIVAAASQFFAICEGIPAIFIFTLEGKTLSTPSIISLPGNPLGIAIVDASRVIVSVDDYGLTSIVKSGITWLVNSGDFEDSKADAEAPEVTDTEKQKLLYTVKSMRKKVIDFLTSQEPNTEDLSIAET
ncbi:tRNA (guanine-N(7)-)-methyltransferase non-catalytic subunit trm82 [Ceratocystis pirilliformis]|uniref:tRNA (Guanine-N(7)-)-methyltransferase non-catalytic subunit trm82 n=1 Tax=Ceratocystis pirilliformis TaxID=259994 RepID=A0ABR3ZHX1_9PEZI